MPHTFRFEASAIVRFSVTAETVEEAIAKAEQYLACEVDNDQDLIDDEHQLRAYIDTGEDGAVKQIELVDMSELTFSD